MSFTILVIVVFYLLASPTAALFFGLWVYNASEEHRLSIECYREASRLGVPPLHWIEEDVTTRIERKDSE